MRYQQRNALAHRTHAAGCALDWGSRKRRFVMRRPADLRALLRRKRAGLLLAAAPALAGLAAPPAVAADLPPQPPPAFIWSGLYIGLNNGYAWLNSGAFSTSAVNVSETPPLPILGLPDRLWGAASAQGATGSVGARLNGFFAGGQLGYNWQFGERYVAGLEADIQGAGVRGGGGFQTLTPAAVYPPFVAATSVNLNRSLEYIGTVRGRLGYAVTPTMLLYATGGLAYGGVLSSAVVRQSLTPSILGTASASSDYFDNRVGWTVGGGVESALTGQISAKLEALYYDLGSTNPQAAPLAHQAIAGPGEVTTAVYNRTRFDGFLVRAGLNYRFAGSAPADGGLAPPLSAP
jgi:opacity protein-like surface antigen